MPNTNPKHIVGAAIVLAAATAIVALATFERDAAHPDGSGTGRSETLNTDTSNRRVDPTFQSSTRPLKSATEMLATETGGSRPTYGRESGRRPFQLYTMHIDRAEGGDARSQYRVSQAIQMCRAAPKSADAFADLRNSGLLSKVQADLIQRHYDECKDLFPLVPDMDGAYTRWLRKAAEGGDSLAKSWDALFSYPNFDEGELRALVGDALRTGEPEAYEHAVMFYANVPSPDAHAAHEAWLLLSCEFMVGCESAQEHERLRREYKLVEHQLILSIEAKLREGLRAKRWGELGF